MSNAFCCSCFPCQEPNQNEINMPDVQNMEQVDDLIDYIDQFISKLDSEGLQQVNKPTSAASSIESGGNLLDKLSKRLNWHVCKKPLLSALDRETRKVLSDVFKEARIIPYLGMALSVIAHTLDRAEQASSNQDKCLGLLRDMFVLAKHMKNLETHLHRDNLHDILLSIVKGTFICARQMVPSNLCRFIFAPVDAAALENLKSDIERLYRDLQLRAQAKTLNRLPTAPGPSQGEYPQNAVGVDEAQNKVSELLDLQDKSRRVVVIYGVGGIGKTTLAAAVFHGLDLRSYSYCRVEMEQDCKQSDLQAIQEKILADAFEEKLKLRDCTEGRQKLLEVFPKASNPVFLFIDNALKQADLEKLLPMEHLSRLPEKSRVLVTTRNLNQTDIFQRQRGIQFSSHRVDSLSEGEAKKILCGIASGYGDLKFDPDVNLENLLKICGGIPLYLKLVGSQLGRLGNTVSACDDTLRYHTEWQREGLDGGEDDDVRERIVDSVYRQLTRPSQEAFLDITFFFHGCERNQVGDIVGRLQLQELEAAALVTTSKEFHGRSDWELDLDWELKDRWAHTTVVKMHDIVRTRGRRLSAGNRITDTESLAILFRDPQKLKQTKGIWLPTNARWEFIRGTTGWVYNGKANLTMIEGNHMDFMSKSLRVLSLGNVITIKGRCERTFEDLRFLDVSFEDVFPIDLSKSSELVYFKSWSMNGHGFPQLPASLPHLRLLHLDGPLDSPSLLDIGQLSSLRKLELLRLKSERICFRNLSSLHLLKMISFSELKGLPENFGELSSLQTLKMEDCSQLERLPESFVNLCSLQELDLEGCSTLERLPESFGNLTSLKELKMNDCSKLERLPQSFGNLSSMHVLDLIGCSMLEGLPESFGNLTSLRDLKMNDCSKLQGLPQTFDQLTRLYRLEIDGCEKMCSLFDNIGHLKCLKFLSMRNCKEVKRLPEDIQCSTSLAAVKAYGCAALEAKAIDSLIQIQSLMFLEIGESPMLIKRWQEIHQHDLPLRPLLFFDFENDRWEDVMSAMFFSGGSRFVQADGAGQVAEVASSSSFPEAGMKVGLLLTPGGMSDEVSHKVSEVASEFQIIYVDVDVKGEAEGAGWMEEREKRIREALAQLPKGSVAWTSPFPKTSLLFAYWLSDFANSVVGTSVLVDEEGRRKLSPLQMPIRRIDPHNIFSPMQNAWRWISW